MLSSATSHCLTIANRAIRDLLLFAGAYLIANFVRFEQLWRLDRFVPPILVGGAAFIAAVYVVGLYSVESQQRSSFRVHLILLTFAFAVGLVAVTLCGYVSFDQRIGRGFMALGCLFSYPLLACHHWLIFHKHKISPQRVAFLAESPEEIDEYHRIKQSNLRGVLVVGRISINQTPDTDPEILGRLKSARKIIKQQKIDTIVFAEQRMEDELARKQLRQLRYQGITCTPLINVCERKLHYVPLHLVSLNWLLYTSNESRDLYFRKLKRLFDILSSLVLLVLLSPFLLLGILIVRFFSPDGPVFFTQKRVGRFGKPFYIWKLRSMRTDAEASGPVWSSAGTDPRVFPGGALLRKYRIDEIPQLINVLRGEMSFVGPRPERPEFVETLSRQIPYYEERHMIHPGLTGWAQVCYPYGSSVEDARCKLEYDLYYLKHAGIVFDMLILLDTIRVVLGGGLKSAPRQAFSHAAPSAGESGYLPGINPQLFPSVDSNAATKSA